MPDFLVKEIIDFVSKEGGEIYKDNPFLKQYAFEHILYHYLMVRTDKKGIIGVARWNIVEDVIKVLDAVVRKDYRNTDLMKNMLTSVWYQHPWLKWVAFERMKDKKKRAYRIHKFLSRRR